MDVTTTCQKKLLNDRAEALRKQMSPSFDQEAPIDELKPKSCGYIKRSQSMPLSLDVLERKCLEYAQYLESCQLLLTQVLTEYQSQPTTHDEILRSIECLLSIRDIAQHFDRRARCVCVFLPLHMPICNLITFCVIPSLMADEIYIHAPKKLAPTLRKVLTVLELKHFFPNISAVEGEQRQFVENYVSDAEVTIFAGKLDDAREIQQRTKPDSLFLFNGQGWNPFVVAADANVDLAVFRAVRLRTHNSGQDHRGPDTILVHDSIVHEFLDLLKSELDQVIKVGSYSDPEVTVGPLIEDEAVLELASKFREYRDYIKYGGTINFAASIVYPTVIVCPLSERTSFDQVSSPVFFINTYTDDSELDTYFGDRRYEANEMYISLFGTSSYAEELQTSTLLRERTAWGVTIGNKEYGGAGHGASFAALNGACIARPILAPREISRFLKYVPAQSDDPSSEEETGLCEENRA